MQLPSATLLVAVAGALSRLKRFSQSLDVSWVVDQTTKPIGNRRTFYPYIR